MAWVSIGIICQSEYINIQYNIITWVSIGIICQSEYINIQYNIITLIEKYLNFNKFYFKFRPNIAFVALHLTYLNTFLITLAQ